MTRRELLAVVTFVQHFRPYLLGREFTLRTDYGALKWLATFREPEGQIARWIEQLQEYNFTILHRAGQKHGNADAMSRIPCQQCGREDTEPTGGTAAIKGISLRGRPLEEVKTLQLNDESLGVIVHAFEK